MQVQLKDLTKEGKNEWSAYCCKCGWSEKDSNKKFLLGIVRALKWQVQKNLKYCKGCSAELV